MIALKMQQKGRPSVSSTVSYCTTLTP